jgi:DNA polymerase III subunit delta
VSRRPRKQSEGLTYDQFRRQVKERRIESLYLFLGEETFLQDRALRLLFEIVEEELRIFSIFTFPLGETTSSGAKASVRDAIDTANELSMMSPRRIVVVRNFDKIREDDQELVLAYLKHPSPTTTVVFQAASIDQRRKLTSALKEYCTVVGFEPLSDKEAVTFAREFLSQRGAEIDSTAMSGLIDLTGSGLMRLTNELNKLAAYADGKKITRDMVELLSPRAREHTNFELWNLIISRDRAGALRLTERLLEDGAEPLMLVGALAGLYRRMLTGKEMMARNSPEAEIQKATGQYGFRWREFRDRLRARTSEEIVRGLHRIAEVDHAIKHSLATPRLQIEYLIAELTMQRRAVATR